MSREPYVRAPRGRLHEMVVTAGNRSVVASDPRVLRRRVCCSNDGRGLRGITMNVSSLILLKCRGGGTRVGPRATSCSRRNGTTPPRPLPPEGAVAPRSGAHRRDRAGERPPRWSFRPPVRAERTSVLLGKAQRAGKSPSQRPRRFSIVLGASFDCSKVAQSSLLGFVIIQRSRSSGAKQACSNTGGDLSPPTVDGRPIFNARLPRPSSRRIHEGSAFWASALNTGCTRVSELSFVPPDMPSSSTSLASSRVVATRPLA